jgi:hypothetical protein
VRHVGCSFPTRRSEREFRSSPRPVCLETGHHQPEDREEKISPTIQRNDRHAIFEKIVCATIIFILLIHQRFCQPCSEGR